MGSASKNSWTKEVDNTKPGVEYEKVKGALLPEFKFTYTEKDTILYALGLGFGDNDQTSDDALSYTFENHMDFKVFPTYGVIPPFRCVSDIMGVDGLNFNPMLLLHGETSLRLHAPIPHATTLTNKGRIVDVYDKKSAASVVVEVKSYAPDNTLIFTNVYTLFIRGIGGFGGPAGPATPPQPWVLPSRDSDFSVTYNTTNNQALIYRLSGDINPLHADPDVAAVAGFKKPILHGLCTYGFAARAILSVVEGEIEEINVRMARPVTPGDSLTTHIWTEYKDNKVYVMYNMVNNNTKQIVLTNGTAIIKNVKKQAKL